MAALSDLVSALSQVTGLPEPTVFAYGRFAREGSLISQGGRGLSAAAMTRRDAANLLIAIAGTQITREAATAVKNFRRLHGRILFCANGFQGHFLDWLTPLGISEDNISADFGKTIEFLIAEAGNAGLSAFLQTIPVTYAPLPPNDYDRGNRPADELSTEVRNELKIEPPLLVIGSEVWLNIVFNRTALCGEIRLERAWGGTTQELLRIVFFGNRNLAPASQAADLNITCNISDSTLRVLGLALRDIRIPPHLKHRGEIAKYLFDHEF